MAEKNYTSEDRSWACIYYSPAQDEWCVWQCGFRGDMKEAAKWVRREFQTGARVVRCLVQFDAP
jgi:hypothetical protein